MGHRLQHRDRCVGVADLSAHQPVGPITKRVLHLLPLSDGPFAFVVGEARLPRLDVGMQDRIEQVEFRCVLDHDNSSMCREFAQAGSNERGLA